MKLKLATTLILFIGNSFFAQETINLTNNIDKIIVSPHIEVTFKKGSETKIEIEDINVPREKFKYEVEKGTLQVYLEGAKTYTKNKEYNYNNIKRKVPLYKNRVVTLTIIYTSVDVFSIRGEEKITYQDALEQEVCKLRIYGSSEVTINEINVDKLSLEIFGDSFIKINKGKINRQKIAAYGASKIMASDVDTKETKITTYGDGIYKINASKKVKVSSFGESKILYKGAGELKKGIVIGDTTIKKVM